MRWVLPGINCLGKYFSRREFAGRFFLPVLAACMFAVLGQSSVVGQASNRLVLSGREGEERPRFIASPIIVPLPRRGSMITALGFLRNGDYVLYDAYNRRKAFDFQEGNPLPVELAGGPVSPYVSDDGELSQWKANVRGKMAVFRYRNQQWVQVTPISAHYSDDYVQNDQGLGVATVKSPNGPWWAVMMENGREIDMRPLLKTKYSKALAVAPDGSILLMTANVLNNWSYFWWRNGKITEKVSMPVFWSSLFNLTPKREFVISKYDGEGWDEKSAVHLLIDGTSAHAIIGPTGPLREVILGNGRWLGGYEEINDKRRAVLIANDHPYYLNDLVQNIPSLRKQLRFHGEFTAVRAIARNGRLIATGFVTNADGSNTETHFLLVPVVSRD